MIAKVGHLACVEPYLHQADAELVGPKANLIRHVDHPSAVRNEQGEASFIFCLWMTKKASQEALLPWNAFSLF